MDRGIQGVGNKILQQKWDNEMKSKHNEKLKKVKITFNKYQVKSQIDLKPPAHFDHITRGGRKDLIVEEQASEISVILYFNIQI